MQKLLTISALIIMLLLQYSRQAAYLHCKIQNIQAAAACDCERIITHATTTDGHDEGLEDVLKPTMPDEFFLGIVTVGETAPIEFYLVQLTAVQHFYSQLFIPTILQPPIC